MFEVIIDSEMIGIRERAKQGNYDSMLYLATCLSRGIHTRSDPDRALIILDHLIERKALIPFKETYWNTLVEKSRILWEREENDIIDQLYLELIQDMTACNPDTWNLEQIEIAARWLRNRAKDKGTINFQE